MFLILMMHSVLLDLSSPHHFYMSDNFVMNGSHTHSTKFILIDKFYFCLVKSMFKTACFGPTIACALSLFLNDFLFDFEVYIYSFISMRSKMYPAKKSSENFISKPLKCTFINILGKSGY